MKVSRQRWGFALLELLAVCAIAALLIVVVLKRYTAYSQTRDISAVQQNVRLLLQDLTQYYQRNCATGVLFTVNLNTLDRSTAVKSHLQRSNIVKQIGDYNVGAHYLNKTTVRGHRDIYQLYVTVTFDVPLDQMSWYQQRLSATQINSGKQLQWNIMPSYVTKQGDSHLWIMNTGLKEFKENSLNGVNNPELRDTSCAY